MLEFIVLGQVPGTHIQITFTWFLFAALIGLVVVDQRMKKFAHAKKPGSKQLTLFG